MSKLEQDVVRLWHVTLTVSGQAVEPLLVRGALQRLSDERPFLHSLRFAADRAEIQYWEEAESLIDAASLALRVWTEHRDSAGLPQWEIVGLEVLERHIFQGRRREVVMIDLHDVTPVPF
ncbi:MAG: hypothetical protein HZY75_06865 [Nocardioidaceae bacterium]|nr:MAG: hypothetical protein HZY75_06865 [Nocardioidaceae bacterium]